MTLHSFTCLRGFEMKKFGVFSAARRNWSRLDGFTRSRTSCRSCHRKTSRPTLRLCRTMRSGTERRPSSSLAGKFTQTPYSLHASFVLESRTKLPSLWKLDNFDFDLESEVFVMQETIQCGG